MAAWAAQLLSVRENSSLSAVQKGTEAIKLTANAGVVWPVAKMAYQELKRVGWDNRSWAARLGLSGAAVGLAVFGGEAAGVAALGTAVGVPLWIVLGSGAAFAGVLIEEFSRR